MAPLLATVAASMAVGVGVSIARLARERRSRRERRLGLLAGESLAGGLQRMALGQLDLALEFLDGGDQAPGEKAVHETRKALKRLRALLALLESELGPDVYAREDAALRDAGRRLAGARDAEVMLDTLDRLLARHGGKLAGRRGVIRLRATLLAERESARRQTLGDPQARAQAVAELRACRERMAAWRLPERPGLGLVESGLLRLYRQGQARRRRAARAGKGEVLAMHKWRKRVKDLRYAAEMLAPAEPSKDERPKGKRARRRRAQARKDAARLRRLASRADSLGEMLGEDHDLAVLAQRVAGNGNRGNGGGGDGGDDAHLGSKTRKTLLKLIAKRRRDLRRRALREGERLYGPSPKKLLRRVRRAHARTGA